MSSLMVAAKRSRHLQFWFAAALVVACTVSFSAASLATTTSNSLQVTAVVVNTCTMAVAPLVSAPPAVLKNVVKVDCQYGQAYTVNVGPAAVDAETAPGKSGSGSANATIVTVTY